jgi:hypothetical protein
MSKGGIVCGIVLGLFVGTIVTWNYTVRKPQINTVIAFLDALKQRDANRLKRVVTPAEYYVYKELYLKNGFNKHLLSYGKPTEKDANNHFFPTQSRFGVRVEEDDIFFGRRTQDYLVCLKKEGGRWRVFQFVTMGDYGDLAALRQFKPSAPVH